MIITGYHGTTDDYANEIVSSQQFVPSQGDKEWLGSGIYFYYEYADALEWTIDRKYENPAILHSIITVGIGEILEMDSPYGRQIVEDSKKQLAKLKLETKDLEENQCFLANYIWHNFKKLKVLSGSFPRRKSIMRTLTDEREKRREFCVRDNSNIKSVSKVGVEYDR